MKPVFCPCVGIAVISVRIGEAALEIFVLLTQVGMRLQQVAERT
jgi:hypothetical protein